MNNGPGAFELPTAHPAAEPTPEQRREMETIAWLASPQGRRIRRGIGPYRPAEALALVGTLRRAGLEPQLASATVTQARLHTAAAPRLGEGAAELILTEDGAQQATRTVVADLHAQRFAAAGVRRVADLGCGIGFDAMALLRAGVDVLAIDIDPVTAAAAHANLRWTAQHHPGAGSAAVRVADATGPGALLASDGIDAVFADPARRSKGRRLNHPEQWSPPLSAVLAWHTAHRALGVKVAPGLAHENIPQELAAQWISVDGDLVECALWSPQLSPSGPGRHATLLTTGAGASVHHLREDPATPGAADPAAPVRPARQRALGDFLLEPDDAVIRAGLIAPLAEGMGSAGLISPQIAYLTADEPASPEMAPFVTQYRVLGSQPFQLKRLRSWLRSLDVGPLTIKKRGTAVVPEDLRSRLNLRGRHSATIVLTPLSGVQSVLLVEPIAHPPRA